MLLNLVHDAPAGTEGARGGTGGSPASYHRGYLEKMGRASCTAGLAQTA